MGSNRPPVDSVDEIIQVWRGELPDVPSLPLELAKRVAQLHGALSGVAQVELDQRGLTKAEADVLARLRSAGAPYRRKPNELSKTLLLSSGGTTHVLQRLTSREMIMRMEDVGDKRSSWVQLTELGVREAEAVVRATTRAHAEVLARLPESLSRELADLLREAIQRLDVIIVTYPR